MQLRTVFLCSFLAVPTLALTACGDDSGGGGSGGDGSTSGASTTTAASSTSGGPGSTGAGTGGEDPTGTGGGDPALSCEAYCTQIADACSDGDLQYPDPSPDAESYTSCMRSCAAFPAGEYGVAGATLGCHQYHADAAGTDPGTHCPHAGPQGGDTCGTPCENFCLIAMEICPDTFATAAACDKACTGDTPGDYSVDPAATGDNLGCREYHLSVAAIDQASADVHCAHIVDSDQCVD